MTTNTIKELMMLQKKEAFLWEQLEEAVELTENTNMLKYLTTELDRIKSKIMEIETQQYFKELDEEYAENSNETTDK
jgi:Ni,Fe-hydrogenase III large subunit